MHKARKLPLMAVTLLGVTGAALEGCVTTLPVDRPCGVLVDSLQNVHATTKDGDRRISDHFERGVAAGCWKRNPALK